MSVRKGQARLRKLAHTLTALPSPSEDTKFLSSALIEIASGKDANDALGVKAKRGERKGEYERLSKIRLQNFMSWVTLATKPIDQEGQGYTLKKAIKIAKENFKDLPSEATLHRYWTRFPERQKIVFQLESD